MSIWMKNWIELDYWARQKNDKKFKKHISSLAKVAAHDSSHQWFYAALLNILNTGVFPSEDLRTCIAANPPDYCSQSYEKLCALLFGSDKPLSAEVMPYCAVYLLSANKVERAIQLFDASANQVLMTRNQILAWLESSISLADSYNAMAKRTETLITNLDYPDQIRHVALTMRYICSWINADYQFGIQLAMELKDFLLSQRKPHTRNYHIFTLYISQLLSNYRKISKFYNDEKPIERLVCIGESRSLSPANMRFSLTNREVMCQASFIYGVKMHHLNNSNVASVHYPKLSVLQAISNSPDGCVFMFAIGEIDCRPDEGIWLAARKQKKDLNEVIEETVDGYVEFLEVALNGKDSGSIVLQGIPAPNYSLSDLNVSETQTFLDMISNVNQRVRDRALQNGWHFLDLYKATVGNDGKSNRRWHIDSHHINPIFYQECDNFLI